MLSDSAGNNVESADAVKTLNVLKDTIANSEYARAFASWPVDKPLDFWSAHIPRKKPTKVRVLRQYIINLLGVMAIDASKKPNFATRTGRRIQPLVMLLQEMFLQC